MLHRLGSIERVGFDAMLHDEHDGGEGAELTVDACLEDDTGVEHDGEPRGQDIEVIRQPDGANLASEDDDDRQDIAAGVEESREEANLESPDVLEDADAVLGSSVMREDVREGEFYGAPESD